MATAQRSNCLKVMKQDAAPHDDGAQRLCYQSKSVKVRLRLIHPKSFLKKETYHFSEIDSR